MPNANPEVTAILRAAGVTAGLTPERLLIVGSQGATATAASGALTQNILNDGAEDSLYDEDSPLAWAIRVARRYNPETQIDAIGLDDAGGATAATGTVTFAGTATEAGTLTVYVGSKKFGAYEVAVTNGDTETIIAGKLVAAITADSRALVTSGNAAGIVTNTAKAGGTFGNTIGMKIEGSVAGITATIAAMSGGATDPDLTGVFDPVGNQRYQGVGWQFDAELDELTDFLDPRFNVTNDVLDGRGFVGVTDTQANHLTALASLNTHELVYNTQLLVDRADYRGPAILEVPFIQAVSFAAMRALRRTLNSSLGDIVTSRSQLDNFGGPWQNSKPYFNTPFADLELPDLGDSFDDLEIKQLVAAGGWVIDTNRARTAVIAGAVVTTYKTDASGQPDPTFTFLNYVDTGSAAREYIANNTRTQYPQSRAVGGQLLDGVDSANEASLAAFVVEKIAELNGLALVNAGTGTIDGEFVDYDKAIRESLSVTLNPVSGKFLVSVILPIVTQVRDIAYDLPIAFEV